MCVDPVTAISIAGTVAKFVGDSDTANKQQEYQDKQREADLRKQAIDRQNLQSQRDTERMDTERAMQQAQEEAAGTVNAHAQDAMREMAAFDAIAGEFGGGASSARGRAAIGIAQGQDLATISSNSRKRQGELGFGDLASASRFKQGTAATNALPVYAAIKRPSMLEAGLTIASAGINYQTAANKVASSKG